MKKIILAAFLASSITLFAVPAKPGIMKSIQPDGSVVEFYLQGDEHFKVATTKGGLLIVENEKGYFEYAEMENLYIKSTGIRVNSEKGAAYARAAKPFEMSRAEINAESMARSRAKSIYSTPIQRSANAAARGIAILVNFKDKSFITKNPRQSFDDMLNKEGYNYEGAIGSAKDYFVSASNGTYSPSFDVYGPYTLDSTMAFYGENIKGEDAHPDQMVVDAMAKLMSDNTIDVNLTQYDTDNDGRIDNVFVFYAGYNEAEGASQNTIWPHAWNVLPYYVNGTITYQGKTIYRYACTSELKNASGSSMAGIGNFAHEFSHVLGLPDLYPTNNATHKTSGYWDIMDMGPYNNNGATPPSYSAYERFFMGWLTPTILSKDSSSLTLENIIDSNKAYLISETGEHNLDGDDPKATEFYLLETRVKKLWDKYLPGEGMIVTKIKYNESKWRNNSPNNDANNIGIDIIEADDVKPSNYGSGYNGKAGDAFPGSSKVTSFSPYKQYTLGNIAFVDSVISFQFKTNDLADGIDTNFSHNDKIFIVKNNTLHGVVSGDVVKCFDMNGRSLWSKIADDNVMNFNAPKGLYALVVTREGKTIGVVKGVN